MFNLKTLADVPTYVLFPAFILNELTVAFKICSRFTYQVIIICTKNLRAQFLKMGTMLDRGHELSL